jgi:hypothetical protein
MTIYKNLPPYLNHRQAILEMASGHKSEFKKLIEQAKAQKLKYRIISIQGHPKPVEWLYIENKGINRAQLEANEWANFGDCLKELNETLLNGNFSDVHLWGDRMTNPQIKEALNWCQSHPNTEKLNSILISKIK